MVTTALYLVFAVSTVEFDAPKGSRVAFRPSGLDVTVTLVIRVVQLVEVVEGHL
jgi:hypothetical protein